MCNSRPSCSSSMNHRSHPRSRLWPSRSPSLCMPWTLNATQGDAVLVIGCGTIGGLSSLLLSKLPQGKLLFADTNAERAALVARICGGAAVGLDKAAIDAALNGERLRYAIDATGNVHALRWPRLLAGGAVWQPWASTAASWISTRTSWWNGK